ncbi:MAG: quinohemoprotein amine dehydrogenase subunit alpha [Longimicrobiales bacterium]|nr:quinohemoprotein amine dehydrogenase subunit alpha [Longimicrobiales bacterium]
MRSSPIFSPTEERPRRWRAPSIVWSTLVAVGALAGSGVEAAGQDSTVGYPIDEPTIVAECSTCHTQDEEGRLSRISYLRKTPEGWQQSLRRMMALHGVSLQPEQAQAVVRYLANQQGLAPEELRPGRFEVERRVSEYDYPGDSGVEFTCIQCHDMGRVITQRRTRDEWALLLATHRALYPLVDFQAFRRAGPPPDDAGSDGAPPDTRHPMDVAIDHLSEVFPLETPEWSEWSVTMRSPRLAGEWALSGEEPGKGPLFGRLIIEADPDDPDAFTTRASYVYPESGERVERAGEALVYTGYQWRGRSNPGRESELREVLFVEPDLREMSGRWFTGAYEEFGPDVTLRRIGSDPVLSGVHPRALLRDGRRTVTVYGFNLSDATEDDFDLGEGVTVEGVEGRGDGSVTLRVSVAASARVGGRALYAGGSSLPSAVVVHDGVDRIAVTPRAGMARVGGAVAPKGFETFDAIGYDDGPDGESETEDDLTLGRVDVSWSLEEYAAVYGDDDVDYVGSIRDDGVFVPALDGPNPERSGNRNNIGDVWVVAHHRTERGRELTARAQLVVTVPLYLQFDPWPSVSAQQRRAGGDG